ncbi:unnamed protein product [Hymenolepis diminuta]|uniref:Uncharacterized protein n=1 Tax=Hymenolepis diminuta TaxID=6216 RepID=A0A564ZDG7_HYMDI|nr:unnamed protein product [Hymenolepis diminuta]
MYPFECKNLVLSLQNAVYLPLNRRQALVHKIPYQLMDYKQTYRWDDSIPDIQGFTEDIDTSRLFFHTWDNRILMVKFLWHKEEHHEECQRGYFFLQCIYQSRPLLQKIQKMNLCKTTGDLLILVDDGLQILGHDGISNRLTPKRNVEITHNFLSSNFAQEPSRAVPESFQPSTPHNLAYLVFNKKRIYSLREKDLNVELSCRQLRDMPNVTLGHDRGGKRYFNALASASNYDCSQNLLAYLAN